MDDTLDLGEVGRTAIAEATARPCSGECGKKWDPTTGGWVKFDPPRWYCVECDRRINGDMPGSMPETD